MIKSAYIIPLGVLASVIVRLCLLHVTSQHHLQVWVHTAAVILILPECLGISVQASTDGSDNQSACRWRTCHLFYINIINSRAASSSLPSLLPHQESSLFSFAFSPLSLLLLYPVHFIWVRCDIDFFLRIM